jgi:UDP-N-acetylmuramoyl-tripeptide--D-alanyl-D-alanine ligase
MIDIKELYRLYQEHPCITTDSRNCPKGSIFLALKGETFDGNKFARQALEKGCAYAIIDNAEVMDNADNRLILVDDCLQTYKDLAREHRRQFDVPVIGITGTNGKTTTKELIRAVLSRSYNVMATEGNFNNDVGVPKTLFRLNDDHDIAVVEMGASHPGDIKTLVETAEPTCGLITNVGRAHLLGFGSFEGVCKTKGELYDYLFEHQWPVFVNRDNEHLVRMSEKLLDVYYYGQSDNEDILIRGEVISCAPFLKFRWREQDYDAGYIGEWMEVQTHLIGAYNLDNILAAITVGYVNNVPFEEICHAVEHYIPTNNRSQLTETANNHLIVDAYNANPTSMAAAIDNFQRMEVSPKMAIIGKMGELGNVCDEEHQRLVDLLRQSGCDQMWLVGDEFTATDALSDERFKWFRDVEEIKAALNCQAPVGYYILIKGSNSNRLFELPPLL